MQESHTLKVVDGRYSVKDKKLGEGSFAKTYMAIDTKSNQVIACKMIEKKNLIEKINLSKNNHNNWAAYCSLKNNHKS